jgi:hypothetical protein
VAIENAGIEFKATRSNKLCVAHRFGRCSRCAAVLPFYIVKHYYISFLKFDFAWALLLHWTEHAACSCARLERLEAAR